MRMSTSSIEISADAIRKSIHVPRHPVWPDLTADEKEELKGRIRKLLEEQNAVLVAHYYTDGELQALAEETGGCVADSLEMARFGTTTHADTIVVCGVRFMGETAKILNPERTVLIPDLEAGCSLAESITAADVRALGDHVRETVRRERGIDLAYEVEFVGDWGT